MRGNGGPWEPRLNRPASHQIQLASASKVTFKVTSSSDLGSDLGGGHWDAWSRCEAGLRRYADALSSS